MGLDASKLRNIFQWFEQVDTGSTRKYDGTGLGLAISRKLCHAMGGTMWAESQGLGKGSTFHFCIKANALSEDYLKNDEKARKYLADGMNALNQLEHDLSSKYAAHYNQSGTKLKIALFDESDMMRSTISCELARWGFSVTLLHSAQDLLSYMNRAIDGNVDEVAVIAEVSSNAIDMMYDWAKSRSLLHGASAGQGHGVSMQSSGDDKSRDGDVRKLPPFIISTWPKIHSHTLDTSDPRCSWARDSVEPSDTSVESAKGTAVLDFFNSINGHRISRPVRHIRLRRALETVLNEKTHHADAMDTARTRDAEDRENTRENVKATPLASQIRILIAEDHPVNMKVAKAVLSRLGYTDVTAAKDGVDALEKVQADPAGLDAFDIVLMDLHMPNMGGIECTKRLRELYPESKVPIIAVTADAIQESRQECFSSGFTSYLTKPFKIETIQQAIQTHYTARDSERET
jgi:CheY-like chemotaxis protein